MSVVNAPRRLGGPASQVISSAQAAEHAIRRLCRTTLTRPSMTPERSTSFWPHGRGRRCATPGRAQLGDILAQANEDHVLETDTLSEIADPDLALDDARLHLDGVGEAALGLYRLLGAAHNQTAHIAIAERLAAHTEQQVQDITSSVQSLRSDSNHRWVAAEPSQVFGGEVADVGSHRGDRARNWHGTVSG